MVTVNGTLLFGNRFEGNRTVVSTIKTDDPGGIRSCAAQELLMPQLDAALFSTSYH